MLNNKEWNKLILRIRSDISIKDRAKSKRRDSVALPSSETPATAVSEKLVRAEFNTDTVARNSLDRVQKRKNVLAGSRRCFQIRCDDRYSSAPPCSSPPTCSETGAPWTTLRW